MYNYVTQSLKYASGNSHDLGVPVKMHKCTCTSHNHLLVNKDGIKLWKVLGMESKEFMFYSQN